MKVSGPNKAGATASVKRAKKSGGASSYFKVDAAPAQTSASAGISSAAPIASLDALINLQSDGASRGKLIAAGKQALALLDRLQQGLLEARLYKRDLTALADHIDQQKSLLASAGTQADPALSALFNDIELRARVELAKLER